MPAARFTPSYTLGVGRSRVRCRSASMADDRQHDGNFVDRLCVGGFGLRDLPIEQCQTTIRANRELNGRPWRAGTAHRLNPGPASVTDGPVDSRIEVERRQ